MLKSSPMSTNRGVAPTSRIALSVATKVKGDVITSSPAPIRWASSDAMSALVPLLTATAFRVPTISRIVSSNASTIGP